MSTQLKVVAPDSVAEKTTGTTVDTIRFTPQEAREWIIPKAFQRPLSVNGKVVELSEKIKNDGGVIPGIITFGILAGDRKKKYMIDGQHRRECFLLSGCYEGFADVRFCFFQTLAEMGEEYVKLNSHLVNMKPDDILRGLEGMLEPLQLIRKKCPFVGYDCIRRGDHSPLLSMSSAIRNWAGSANEIPSISIGVATLAQQLQKDDAEKLIKFLNLAYEAWGRENDYNRLWAAVNMRLCMWLYRRLVLQNEIARPTLKRHQIITDELFRKCMIALTAEPVYLDWLVGRHMGERDRSPAYNKIKGIFASRLYVETGKKFHLPQPAWTSH